MVRLGAEARAGGPGRVLVAEPVGGPDHADLRDPPGEPGADARPGDGPARLRPQPDAGGQGPGPGGPARGPRLADASGRCGGIEAGEGLKDQTPSTGSSHARGTFA